MPFFVSALLGGLIQIAGSLAGRVMLSLGFSFVAFSGVDTSITWARDFLVDKIGVLPANAVAVAGTMKLGVCISILTSALAARMLMQGLTSGTVRKWIQG
jgi:hypothetical protein